jgi:hypothetical protein
MKEEDFNPRNMVLILLKLFTGIETWKCEPPGMRTTSTVKTGDEGESRTEN